MNEKAMSAKNVSTTFVPRERVMVAAYRLSSAPERRTAVR